MILIETSAQDDSAAELFCEEIFFSFWKKDIKRVYSTRAINQWSKWHSRKVCYVVKGLLKCWLYSKRVKNIWSTLAVILRARSTEVAYAASIIFPIKKSRGKEENLPGSIRRYFFSPKNRKMLYNIREAGCLRSILFFILFSFVELLQKRYLRARLLRVRIAGGTIAEVKTNQFLWSLAESS